MKKEDVILLFNPFHDRLGRFATRTGGSSSIGAREFEKQGLNSALSGLEKPTSAGETVGTIGGSVGGGIVGGRIAGDLGRKIGEKGAYIVGKRFNWDMEKTMTVAGVAGMVTGMVGGIAGAQVGSRVGGEIGGRIGRATGFSDLVPEILLQDASVDEFLRGLKELVSEANKFLNAKEKPEYFLVDATNVTGLDRIGFEKMDNYWYMDRARTERFVKVATDAIGKRS